MNVLIISQHFWPESFRINDVAQSLCNAGCQVTVLTGQPNYPHGTVFPGYRAASIRRQEHAQCSIQRVPMVPRGNGRALALVLNYLSFLISASVLGPWLLRGRKYDAILVYGTSPILQAIPGIVLKWLKRAPLVTWVQDLWPQSLSATGFVQNRHLLAMVGTVVRWIYRRSNLLLVQSKAFIPSVSAMAGRTCVEYHPNPAELAFSDRSAEATSALQFKPGFNVVFAGNLGTVQALDTVLDSAELLRTQTDVRFVLIGGGSRADWLRSEIARRSLENVDLPGIFAPQAMPGILAKSSVLLLSLVPSEIMSQTVPSKLQAYLAAGRPIIASIDGEAARVLREAGAGLSTRAGDARALAEAVLDLRARPAVDLSRMGESGRRYYEEHFEPAHLAVRLCERLRRLSATVR